MQSEESGLTRYVVIERCCNFISINRFYIRQFSLLLELLLPLLCTQYVLSYEYISKCKTGNFFSAKRFAAVSLRITGILISSTKNTEY